MSEGDKDLSHGVMPRRSWAIFDQWDHWLLRLERVGLALAGATIGVSFLMLIGGVLTRPWTGFLFSVALESGKLAMWPVTYLGAALLWRTKSHVRFEFFLIITSGRKHHSIELFNHLLALVIALSMTYLTWRAFLFIFYSKAATLTFLYPYWPAFWTGFAGTGLLSLEIIFSFLRHMREFIHPTGAEKVIFQGY